MPPFGSTQLKLIEKLCNSIGISGDEDEVRKIVLDEIKPYTDEVKVDTLGNVLAIKHGRGKNRVSGKHPCRNAPVSHPKTRESRVDLPVP